MAGANVQLKVLADNARTVIRDNEHRVWRVRVLACVKGRLQYLVRDDLPKAFRRNYSIQSVGEGNQKVVEDYVAKQLQQHRWADPRIATMLAPYQLGDLGLIRQSSHGQFVYNLHFVAVHQERYAAIREEDWKRTSQMLQGVARKKEHRLSRVGLDLDHVHWTIGCPLEESPLEIGLCYLNNLAFAHGMRPLYQFGLHVGTFGTIGMGAVRPNSAPLASGRRSAGASPAEALAGAMAVHSSSGSSLRRGEPGGGVSRRHGGAF